MALFGKVGGIVKQALGKQVDLLSSPSNPSIFQALRWMSSSKVFIGGLSYSTDENGLREAFSNYGEVHDARVIQDRETGRSRGFGFVTYSSSEEASSAIQALDGQDLHGRRIRVAYATDRARPTGGFGGGGFGGGGYGGGGYGGGGGGYGGGGYGGEGGNQGGNYGGGGYGSGGFGGYGSGNQGGVDGYASGGGNYGASGSSNASYGGGANFGVSGGAGGNVAGNTSFGASGFEEGSGLGHDGGNDQFGIGSTSGLEDKAGDYEPNELQDRDEDENDDFAKKA